VTCIINHMTTPTTTTTADEYSELGQLVLLVDEYYQLEMLDPGKMSLIQLKIWDLIQAIDQEMTRYDLIHIPRNVSGQQCPGSITVLGARLLNHKNRKNTMGNKIPF